MNDSYALGVDIGGSHIAAALIDIHKFVLLGDTLTRNRVDSGGTKEHIINTWCSTMQQSLLLRPATNVSIGIAMPGPFDYKKGISLIREQKKYRSLYGLNVRQMIAAKLNSSVAGINFLNDACSFLLGEVLAGAAANKQHAIGITLGTGLGSAIFSNGAVTDADLWQLPFKSGVAEDYLSTRWFTKAYSELKGREVEGVKELTVLAKEDKTVRELFEEFGENLSSFLTDVLQTDKNCETVVIGGNISKAGDLFLSSTRMHLEKTGIKVKIMTSSLGESAAMIGAAGAFHDTVLLNGIGGKLKLV